MTHDRSGSKARKSRVLCISSSGGHWQQLMTFAPAWQGFEAHYACTSPDVGSVFGITDLLHVPDCNRDMLAQLLRSIPAYVRTFRAVRPDAVVTTGALPGLFFIVLARLSGAKAIWIESIANSEKLSLSGVIASHFATSFFVQAAHLADGKKRVFAGSIF